MIDKKNHMVVVAFVVLVTACGFVPIRYLATPAWRVVVVDEQGHPMESITVRLAYQNYSAESKGHEQDLLTDSHGIVEFQSSVGSASIARRVFYSLYAARAGIHASFGRHASILVFGQGRRGYAVANGIITDWTGSPDRMESRVLVAKADLPTR